MKDCENQSVNLTQRTYFLISIPKSNLDTYQTRRVLVLAPRHIHLSIDIMRSIYTGGFVCEAFPICIKYGICIKYTLCRHFLNFATAGSFGSQTVNRHSIGRWWPSDNDLCKRREPLKVASPPQQKIFTLSFISKLQPL